MKRLVLAFTLLASLAALPALATVPSTMSYQGVLTDAGGNLLPDGPYSLTFKIYTVPVAGAPIWTEVDAGVPVSKGGFSVVLGNGTSLSGLAFDVKYYLGITVGGGPELSPRVELAASPYGMSLRLPFSGNESSAGPVLSIHNGGAGPAISADPRLDVGSTTSDGTINVLRNGSTNPVVSAHVGSTYGNGGQLDMKDENGTVEASLFPYSADGYWLYVGGDASGVNGIAGVGNYDGLNNPTLFMIGANDMFFNTANTGDATVQLPTDAIDSGEILDEPGIAQGHVSGSMNLGTSMTDIVTATITIPSTGYIVVEADGQHNVAGNGSTFNYASLQITETSGSGLDSDHYFVSGYGGVAPSGSNYHPVSIRRTYFKNAGTYTFYFQGYKSQGASLFNYVFDPTITATYYPTSYGGVTTVANATVAAHFAHAQRVTQTAAIDQPTGNGYLVDLRELEMKAAAQRAALAKTERDLVRAKMQAALKASQAPAKKR
jgi:hypothetical protein